MAEAYVANSQVLDGLIDFINARFDFEKLGLKPLEYEQTTPDIPSCGIFAETGTVKNVINIIGDWECYFRFRIDLRADGNETSARVLFSQFFDELARFFEKETAGGLVGLLIGENRTPIKCEMETLPAKISVDAENTLTFSAYFVLLYNEKRSIKQWQG